MLSLYHATVFMCYDSLIFTLHHLEMCFPMDLKLANDSRMLYCSRNVSRFMNELDIKKHPKRMKSCLQESPTPTFSFCKKQLVIVALNIRLFTCSMILFPISNATHYLFLHNDTFLLGSYVIFYLYEKYNVVSKESILHKGDCIYNVAPIRVGWSSR